MGFRISSLTLAIFITMLTVSSVLIRILSAPIFITSLFFVLFGLWGVFFQFRIFPTKFSAGFWIVVFFAVGIAALDILYSVAIVRSGDIRLNQAHLSLFAMILGWGLGELFSQISFQKSLWALKFTFWIIVGICLAEWLWFNFVPGGSPFNYLYYPGAKGTSLRTYTSPDTLGLIRYWGPFGSHSGTASLIIGIMALVIDSFSKSRAYIYVAALICAVSLSGMGLIVANLLLVCRFGRLLAPHIQKLWFQLTMLGAFLFVFLSLIGFDAISSNSALAKLNSQYMRFLIELKYEQISEIFDAFAQSNPESFIFGLKPAQLLLLNVGHHFASSDFGLAYRLGYGGMLGIAIFFGQLIFLVFLTQIGFEKSRIHQAIAGVFLLLFIIHYSPLNVLTATFIVTLSFRILLASRSVNAS